MRAGAFTKVVPTFLFGLLDGLAKGSYGIISSPLILWGIGGFCNSAQASDLFSKGCKFLRPPGIGVVTWAFCWHMLCNGAVKALKKQVNPNIQVVRRMDVVNGGHGTC